MTQPRLFGAVTENPLGTLSFYKAETGCYYTDCTRWNTRIEGVETAQGSTTSLPLV